MEYPKHVKAVLGLKLPFNPQRAIDSYYNSLPLSNKKDTPENFKLAFYCFCEGHGEGVKKCTENG